VNVNLTEHVFRRNVKLIGAHEVGALSTQSHGLAFFT
jgi:hypothetical protein